MSERHLTFALALERRERDSPAEVRTRGVVTLNCQSPAMKTRHGGYARCRLAGAASRTEGPCLSIDRA